MLMIISISALLEYEHIFISELFLKAFLCINLCLLSLHQIHSSLLSFGLIRNNLQLSRMVIVELQ